MESERERECREIKTDRQIKRTGKNGEKHREFLQHGKKTQKRIWKMAYLPSATKKFRDAILKKKNK